jgi:hypothetical protein
MLCPGTSNDCDNPGCRHGGCQGRKPELPLFRRPASNAAATLRVKWQEPRPLRRMPEEREPIAA